MAPKMDSRLSSSARTSNRDNVPSRRLRPSTVGASSQTSRLRTRAAQSVQEAAPDPSFTRCCSSFQPCRHFSPTASSGACRVMAVIQSSQFRMTSLSRHFSSSSTSHPSLSRTYGDFRTANTVARLPLFRNISSQEKTSLGRDRSCTGELSAWSTGIPLSEKTECNRE